jgi:hypothetical protein
VGWGEWRVCFKLCAGCPADGSTVTAAWCVQTFHQPPTCPPLPVLWVCRLPLLQGKMSERWTRLLNPGTRVRTDCCAADRSSSSLARIDCCSALRCNHLDSCTIVLIPYFIKLPSLLLCACPPPSPGADLVFQVVHSMWRRLERATAAAAAAGSSARPGSVAAAQQDRFWQAVARKPAALAFFAKYYLQQVCAATLQLVLLLADRGHTLAVSDDWWVPWLSVWRLCPSAWLCRTRSCCWSCMKQWGSRRRQQSCTSRQLWSWQQVRLGFARAGGGWS